VRLDDAVAIGGRPMGAAKKGLAALVVEWDEGPMPSSNTSDIRAELDSDTQFGTGCTEYRRCRRGHGARHHKIEATYRSRFWRTPQWSR